MQKAFASKDLASLEKISQYGIFVVLIVFSFIKSTTCWCPWSSLRHCG